MSTAIYFPQYFSGSFPILKFPHPKPQGRLTGVEFRFLPTPQVLFIDLHHGIFGWPGFFYFLFFVILKDKDLCITVKKKSFFGQFVVSLKRDLVRRRRDILLFNGDFLLVKHLLPNFISYTITIQIVSFFEFWFEKNLLLLSADYQNAYSISPGNFEEVFFIVMSVEVGLLF